MYSRKFLSSIFIQNSYKVCTRFEERVAFLIDGFNISLLDIFFTYNQVFLIIIGFYYEAQSLRCAQTVHVRPQTKFFQKPNHSVIFFWDLNIEIFLNSKDFDGQRVYFYLFVQ